MEKKTFARTPDDRRNRNPTLVAVIPDHPHDWVWAVAAVCLLVIFVVRRRLAPSIVGSNAGRQFRSAGLLAEADRESTLCLLTVALECAVELGPEGCRRDVDRNDPPSEAGKDALLDA